MRWVLLLLILISVVQAQEVPLCANIKELPYKVAPTPNILIQVDTSVCYTNPPGTKYQFWRHVLVGSPANEFITPFISFVPPSVPEYTFTGAGDGEIFVYKIRSATDTDTSLWDSVIVMHDLNPPAPVPALQGKFCYPHADSFFIYLTWQKAYDTGCGVREYRIYRSTNPVYLSVIDESDMGFIIDWVPEIGAEMYMYVDSISIFLGNTYYYCVVPIDSAGNPLYPGHYPHYNNPRVAVTTSGPGECWTFMPSAPLLSAPRWITEAHYTVRVNTTTATFGPYALFQYKLVDSTAGTEQISEWTSSVQYDWALSDCHEYWFYARAINTFTGDTSAWFYTGPSMCDISGPQCVDTIVVTPQNGYIHVRFTASDEANLDCGAGLSKYVLYRLTENQFDSFFPIGPEDSIYALRQYYVSEYSALGQYDFYDDSEYDPVIDLYEDTLYYYLVVAYDSLGNIGRICGRGISWDTASVDKGVVPVTLLELPSWSPGSEVTLYIIDTSYCDITQLEIIMSYSADFLPSVTTTFGPYEIHDPIFSNPDDHFCRDWDTLQFTITGLDETQYYFKVRSYDSYFNQAFSNVVVTRFDRTPPAPTCIDSVHSYAYTTNHVRMKIWWRPSSSDPGCGVGKYKIYRSTTPEDLGDSIGTVEHSPFTSVYSFLDISPNPGNNWRENYYTIVSVDKMGNENRNGLRRGFPEGTPPFPVKIDSVFSLYENSSLWVVITWSDTTPSHWGSGGFGNLYRVEYAGSPEWLMSGDPTLRNFCTPTYQSYIKLPHTQVMRGSPRQYFQIATIDQYTNESGYSEIYMFYDSLWIADTQVIHLYPGYNLVSLSVYPRSLAKNAIFPDLQCLEWIGEIPNFVPAESLQIGRGYFVFSLVDRDIEVVGMRIPEYRYYVSRAGWVFIGATSDTVSIGTRPADALVNTFWRYNPSTQSFEPFFENRFVPGVGYCIQVSAPCTLYAPAEVLLKETHREGFMLWANNVPLFLGIGEGIDSPVPPHPFLTELPALIDEFGEQVAVDFRKESRWRLFLPDKCTVKWETPVDMLIRTGFISVDMEHTTQVELLAGEYEIIQKSTVLPSRFSAGIFPNPFNSSTQISISVPKEGQCKIVVTDIKGSVVSEIHNGIISAGEQEFLWNTQDSGISSGLYFISVQLNNEHTMLRALLVK